MKKFIFILVLLILSVILVALVFDWGRNDSVLISVEKDLSVILDTPKENQEVASPLKISGQAKGSWFFEGSFSVELVDTNRDILVKSIATSTEDWMTDNFISFSATLKFIKPTSTKHVLLVLRKNNPSDIRELDESISIPLILR